MPHSSDDICPPLEDIEQLLIGRSLSDGLRAHVAACAACREMVERLREDRTLREDVFGRVAAQPDAGSSRAGRESAREANSGRDGGERGGGGSSIGGRTVDTRRIGGGPGSGSTSAAYAIPGYPIVGEIHRGGQGVVYEALQESTQRRVAIKVLREGAFADREDRARFEREVLILGQLRHPNIVTIHDSGEIDGRAYFVMDYIPGKPLDAWVHDLESRGPDAPADGASSASASGVLTPKARILAVLRLFQTICEAVNVAHLRGVIHRDLKPSNIRVDPDGRPLVLDFGLAKLVVGGSAAGSTGSAGSTGPASATAAIQNPKSGIEIVMTETGQFLGSLPWASPEQAGGMASDLDIRTDVYSLGVILFQALTGKFPYDVTGPLRIVLDRIVNAAPLRPRALVPQIDDELETIVLRCLNKERDRRYQSAGELAGDIGRYLAGEPIAAKRDSFGYVLRKQIARHRALVAVAAAFLATVVTALVVSLALWRTAAAGQSAAIVERGKAERAATAADIERGKAELAATDARRETEKATELSRFLSELLLSANPMQKGRKDVTVREVIDEFAVRLDSGALDAQPETVAELRRILGAVYNELGLYPEAERHLRAALEGRTRIYGADHRETAHTQNELAVYLIGQRKTDEAAALLESAEKTLRAGSPELAPHLAMVLMNLGGVAVARRDPARAERLFREGLTLNPTPEDRSAINVQLATLLARRGLIVEAVALQREELAYRRERYPAGHPEIAHVLNDLGLALQKLGQLDEAERCIDEALSIWRTALPEGHMITAIGLNSVGLIRTARGDAPAAEAAHRESLSMLQRQMPPDHPFVMTAVANLITSLCNQKKHAEAEEFALAALTTLRKSPENNEVAFTQMLASYGSALLDSGRYAEAEAAYDECLAIRLQTMPDRWEPYYTMRGLARAHYGQQHYAEAEKLLLDAYAGLQKYPPDLPARIGDVLAELVLVYTAYEKPQEAESWRRKYHAWQATTQPASAPTTAPAPH